MTKKILYLVVDTNLFFECKQLEELPWNEISKDSIVILLTKPLLDEVDKHKKVNGRTRDRALKIFKRIRTMKKEGVGEKEILVGPPNVKIRVATGLLPDDILKGQLDYTKNDDRLLGILSTVHQDALYSNVSLLTHDIGPASNADGLSLPNILIEDHWLRPPPMSQEGKKAASLEQELTGYRNQEPNIKIDLLSPEILGKNFVVKWYEAAPLSKTQMDELMAMLKEKRPVATEFPTNKGLVADNIFKTMGTEISYEPPTEKEIEEYENTEYPQWIDDCREVLSNLHTSLSNEPSPINFHYEMKNVGGRPASKVRVKFQADGDIYMRREKYKDEDEPDEGDGNEQSKSSHISLPRCPSPPQGTRVVKRRDVVPGSALASVKAAQNILGNNPAVGDMIRLSNQYRDLMAGSVFSKNNVTLGSLSHPPMDMSLLMPLRAPKHNPEGFYYKEWSDGVPVNSGSLTCDLWRHASDTEHFEFEVLFDREGGGKGVVISSIHAENLTHPEIKKTPVRLKVETIDTYAEAKKLILHGRVKRVEDETISKSSLPKLDSE